MYSTSLIYDSSTFVLAKLINLLMTLTYKSGYSCDHHIRCKNKNQLVSHSTLDYNTIQYVHSKL